MESKMNRKHLLSIAAAVLASALASEAIADAPTPAAAASQVQTHLRLELKDDVKEVHFVNTNNDPYVYTKVYVLKNADPYEILPYVVNAVGGIWQPTSAYSTTDVTGGRPGSGIAPGGYTGIDPQAVINNADPQGQWWYYQGRRVNTSNTKVEGIKYLDGTGALIISAEDYRFTKEGNENGLSIDEIVASLDLPNIINSAGQQYVLYFPKYWDAASLSTAIKRAGLDGNWTDPAYNSQWGLQEGKDRVRVDSNLNALFFYLTTYNTKHVQDLLALYDKPSPEVFINLNLYELDDEVDSLVGTDFQAWKNGPGSDLFSVASRYTNGWDIAAQNVNHTVNSNTSKYINFNPRINSRYIDAISAAGRAKSVTRGSISVLENSQGYLASTVRFPTIQDGSNFTATGVSGVRYLKSSSGVAKTALSIGTAAVTEGGSSLPTGSTLIQGTATSVNVWVVETAWVTTSGTGSSFGNTTQYVYNFQVTGVDGTAYFQDSSGNNLGSDINVYAATYPTSGNAAQITTIALTGYSWVSGTNDPYAAQSISKGTKRNSVVSALGSDSSAGFIAKFGYAFSDATSQNVAIAGNQTTVPISLTNTSLVGFQNDGTLRTLTSTVNTVVQVNNKGERFVIGGLEKEAVVRSVSKVPWLGDIPGLGYVFDTEREVHKTTKLVAVLDIVPVLPDTAVAADVLSLIANDQERLKNYGTKVFDGTENDQGFDQFLLDSEKKSLDPLP